MPINKNMKGFGEKKQSKKRKNNSIKKDIVNKNELLKKAFNLQTQGEKLEAAKYYAYLIMRNYRYMHMHMHRYVLCNDIRYRFFDKMSLKYENQGF